MAKILNEIMDVVHDLSLPTIELLQKSFPNNESFMISISTLLDPRYVFLIYAPLLFAVNKRVGHRMIMALTLAEWSNQILKWLLAGERPYWYVHERANELRLHAEHMRNMSMASALTNDDDDVSAFASAFVTPALSTHLKQFPVTCELGAGSPSGHAMVTATVWYILIDAYLRNELPLFGRVNYATFDRQQQSVISSNNNNNKMTTTRADKLAKLSWSLYMLMLVAVSLSRVYLACHFPHQCLCGALLGALTARLVTEHVPMKRLRTDHFIALTSFMLATALGTYALLRLSGFDPLWSVGKAMRWCVKKEYIHLDTTPFFSMVRYLGFCFGTGLAYDASKIISGERTEKTQSINGLLVIRRLVGAALAVAFGQLLLALPAPKAYLYLFYGTQFVVYAIFSYAIAGPIPKLAKKLVPVSNKNKID